MTVVVFGSIGADLVTTVSDFPQAGQTVVGTSFSQVPGGKGANQAVVACSAGAKTHMAGAVGDDTFATLAKSILVKSGVDLSCVKEVKGSTGIATIFVSSTGQNSIAVFAGANALAKADSVPDELLTKSTVLVLQHECPLAENEKLAKRAKQFGAQVVLNAAPAYDLEKSALENVDVLIVNETEAQHLANQHRLPFSFEMSGFTSFARSASEFFNCTVLVTLGEKGAVLAKKDFPGLFQVAAPKVNVVDTTGAGDAFVGAFSAVLEKGLPLDQALRYGIAAGSLACEIKGAQVALDVHKITQLAETVSVQFI